MAEHPELRRKVLRIAKLIKTEITKMGFETTHDETPIIPVFFRSYDNACMFSEFMKDNGIIVPFINYPVEADKFLVRITASVNHTDIQIEELFNVFRKWRNKYKKGCFC